MKDQPSIHRIYQPLADSLYEHMKTGHPGTGKYVVIIGGESGSGKSTLADALRNAIITRGIGATILHLDDYFLLPPKANHQQRLTGLHHVGPQEVNLALLQAHISAFKNGENQIVKPWSDAENDRFVYQTVDLSASGILIVEGTYALTLDQGNFYVKMGRTYQETRQLRIERARDPIDEFTEKVLEIEHRYVAPMVTRAHAVVEKNYTITYLQPIT